MWLPCQCVSGDHKVKTCAVLILGLSLSGCGLSATPSYRPVTLYDDDVAALRERLLSLSPAEMLREGITESNIRCDDFFDKLDKLRAKADFRIGRLASLSTGVTPILELTEAASDKVAIVAAALGFATDWVKDRKEIFLLAELKPQAYTKWQEARAIAKRPHLH